MRTTILNYLKSQSLSPLSVTMELPWDADGQLLYQKNMKKVYVDQGQQTTDPLIQTLSGTNIAAETTTIRAYFTTDAKQLPTNYDSVVSLIRAGKTATGTEGYHQRECDVITSFDNDTMTTEFEFRFIKLL